MKLALDHVQWQALVSVVLEPDFCYQKIS